MIQRKQSAYLLLGSLALGAALYFGGGVFFGVFPGYVYIAFGVGGGAASLGVACIFTYGNRERQHALAFLAQMLALLSMALFAVGMYAGSGGAPDAFAASSAATGRAAATGALVCAYALFRLARRAIRADIELVRSADRLR